MEGTPHRLVAGECGVHRKNMLNELVIGVEVRSVVENDEREEQGDGCEKESFRPSRGCRRRKHAPS